MREMKRTILVFIFLVLLGLYGFLYLDFYLENGLFLIGMKIFEIIFSAYIKYVDKFINEVK